MNWDILAGKWKQYTGMMKVRWGKFNDDQFDVIDGRRMRSEGMNQEAKGIARGKMRQKEKLTSLHR